MKECINCGKEFKESKIVSGTDLCKDCYEKECRLEEKSIQINYETIGVVEQRNLLELANTLNRALTKEEYSNLVGFYYRVVQRLDKEAKKQGIEI